MIAFLTKSCLEFLSEAIQNQRYPSARAALLLKLAFLFINRVALIREFIRLLGVVVGIVFLEALSKEVIFLNVVFLMILRSI